jgi:NAD(P)-dependent dehydrogenase (short-subunit alcohol dehydrogenase family)
LSEPEIYARGQGVAMTRFKGKVVLVTGGNSGIGQTAAVRFAAEGAQVVSVGRTEATGLKTVELIERAGGHAFYKSTDVSQEDEVAALVREIVDRFGGLHIAFNNAGVHLAGPLLHEISREDYRRLMSVDLDGVFFCMKHEISHFLKSGGGVIVNCASIAGHVAIKGNSAYTAAKHGVIGLTKAAGLDYAAKNIRTNCVCPGATLTPMMKTFVEQGGQEALKKLQGEYPIGRFASTDEVANLVLWLASDESSYILGQSILVDGGGSIF